MRTTPGKRCGLGIIDAVRAPNSRDDMMLQVRIGIANGLVIAGDIVGKGASKERAVPGDTPNLAARFPLLSIPHSQTPCMAFVDKNYRSTHLSRERNFAC
jgi:hypothetical protein